MAGRQEPAGTGRAFAACPAGGIIALVIALVALVILAGVGAKLMQKRALRKAGKMETVAKPVAVAQLDSVSASTDGPTTRDARV